MALQQAPFGTYVNITGTVDATAKSQIQTNLEELKRLIPSGAEGTSPADHPDFDAIRPEYAEKVHAELDAINALIQAA